MALEPKVAPTLADRYLYLCNLRRTRIRSSWAHTSVTPSSTSALSRICFRAVFFSSSVSFSFRALRNHSSVLFIVVLELMGLGKVVSSGQDGLQIAFG